MRTWIGLPFCVLVLAGPLAADSGLIAPGASLQVVYSSSDFHEGPAWDPFTARLYFTALTGTSRVLRLDSPGIASIWLNNSQGINGTFLGNDGRLLCAQGDARRIVAMTIGLAGPEDQAVLASNSAWLAPNDLCQIASGDIYFTTPNFGGTSSSYVYRRAPNGSVTTVVTDMPRPNGIIAANDGRTLYVSDSSMKWWRSYPIAADGSVGAGATFFNPATANTADPDGMTIDELGNLYFNGRGGLWIVSPQGAQLEFIPVTEFNTNATFGGIDGKTLYITCDKKVYSLAMQVRGAAWRGTPMNNQPPQVNAGPDRTVNSRHRVNYGLEAVISDDHQPNPPDFITVKWFKVSGPGEVAFADRTAPNTSATFSLLGSYQLRIIAFDSIRSTSDDISITITRVADLDHDTDVDQTDFEIFKNCMTGPDAGPPAVGCGESDIDEDNDVDQTDFGLFQRCFSGIAQTSNPDCAN